MYKGEFFFSSPVLSSNESIEIKEITVKEYLSLLKFLKNNNLKHINFYIEYLLKKIIVKNYERLNVLDKFIILINLRSIILGSELFLLQSDTNIRMKISIDDIIASLLSIKLLPVKKINFNKIEIGIDYPNNFITDEKDIFIEFIKYIEHEDKKIYFANLTEDEKASIIDSLPVETLKPIKGIILEFENNFKQNILFKTLTNDIYGSLIDDTLLQLLKILLTDDLQSIYDLSFILISKSHFSWGDLMQLNPAEMQIFYRRLVEENKEIEKIMKQSKSPLTNLVDSMK